MAYLTIDMDFYRTDKEWSDFLNSSDFKIKNIHFKRNHHSLSDSIIRSKDSTVINIDWHDDLNTDIIRDQTKLHCGNWAANLLNKKLIKDYYWFHPDDDGCECDGIGGFNFIRRHFKFNISKYQGLDYWDYFKNSINHVGVCVSPTYHCMEENVKPFVKIFIDWCIERKLTINGKNAHEYRNGGIRKWLIANKDED